MHVSHDGKTSRMPSGPTRHQLVCHLKPCVNNYVALSIWRLLQKKNCKLLLKAETPKGRISPAHDMLRDKKTRCKQNAVFLQSVCCHLCASQNTLQQNEGKTIYHHFCSLPPLQILRDSIPFIATMSPSGSYRILCAQWPLVGFHYDKKKKCWFT